MNLTEQIKQLELAEPVAVLGMGISGSYALTCLQLANVQSVGLDENKELKNAEYIDLSDPNSLSEYKTIIISPGIDSRKAAIKNTNAVIINDIEIFARLCKKTIIGVTGSNGKSTVVSMLDFILNKLGKKSVLCGNIGRSVLEALSSADDNTDFFVLELSNYQLERCPSLHPKIATILNISPDHLDRYDSYQDYINAKANLAKQADICVLNAEDENCLKIAQLAKQTIFASAKDQLTASGILINNEEILNYKNLSIQGKANYYNSLVALLMLEQLGISPKLAAAELANFQGLAHRATLVTECNGISWIDDSKATNIGATIAALNGIEAPIWLIVGGVGKGQDFSLLANAILQKNIKKILLIGIDNSSMEQALKEKNIDFKVCGEMAKAISYAYENAVSGDVVLLSPATASFDQFSGYAERGNCFAAGVKAICQ